MTESAVAPASGVRAWITLVALSLPMVALSVDANGVVVLLPTIGRDLGAQPAAMSVVVTVASIAFAAPLILIGRIADRVGSRPLLLVGVAGFGVASAICALTDSYGVLLAGRALQGVASACCFATSLAAIDAVFPSERLPVAIGIWGALGGIGSAAGPLVASVIGDVWSWRVFFGVNIVILGVAFVMLVLLVPRLPSDRSAPFPLARLLWLSFGIWAAFGALQTAGAVGWLRAGVAVPLVAGVAVIGFVLRRGTSDLVPPTVTAASSFRVGTAEATLSNWGSGVLMVLVPTALQTLRGMTVLGTGVLFLAFSVPFAIGGALSGPLARRMTARGALAFGSAVLAAGLLGLAVVGIEASMPVFATVLAVAGFGNGIVYSASTAYGLAAITVSLAAEASALLNMCRVLGLALSVALSNSLLHAFGSRGDTGLRVVLLVAAAICAFGVPAASARRAP